MNIPGYTIIRELGSGGMATVYLARQDRLSREVALKVMKPIAMAGGDFTSRFVKEGQIIAQLQHPQIVTIYDFDSADGCHYFSMEYLPGGTLGDEIRLQRGLPVARAIEITRKVAEALAVAHARGVIHRDVKPQNILFRADRTPVLTDFGIAHAVNRNADSMQLTSYGMVIGSPRYMSPEQSTGQPLDPRSDLYSLGVVFFEMLTNRLPYEADDVVSLAMKHCSDPIPRLPNHLALYQDILDRLIAKQPADRFDNAQQLIQALNALEGRTLTTTPSEDKTRIVVRPPSQTAMTIPPRPLAPSRMRWGLVLSIVALLAAAGGYMALRKPNLPRDAALGALPAERPGRASTATQYERLAVEHFQKMHFERSLHIIKLGLAETPDDERLLALRAVIARILDVEWALATAQALLQQDRLDDSLAHVEKGLALAPDDSALTALDAEVRARIAERAKNRQHQAETILTGARKALAAGQFADAAAQVEEGLERWPDHPDLLALKQTVADALARSASASDPSAQATQLLAAGDALASLRVVERALAQRPDDAQLLDLRETARKQRQRDQEQSVARSLEEARAQQSRGELAQALATIERALKRQSDEPRLKALEAALLAAREKTSQTRADDLLAQAEAALGHDDPRAAKAKIAEGLSLLPNHPRLLALRASMDDEPDRTARSATALERCNRYFALKTMRLDRLQAAADCYAAITQADPNNDSVRQRLAAITDQAIQQTEDLLEHHELDLAAKGMAQLQAIAPDDPRLARLLTDLDRRRSLTPEMTEIPAGCFDMGSPGTEAARESDERQHQVCLKAFRLAPTEVSVGQFRAFVAATAYRTDAERETAGLKGCWAFDLTDKRSPWRYQTWAGWNKPNRSETTNDDDAVSCVSWNDAQAYVDWLNQQTGARYRLPTEAEWEYAARAGSGTARYWGNEIDSQACRYANAADTGHGWGDGFPCNDGYEWVARIGHLEPNAWGLKDMLGNLWEWTCSEYDADAKGKEQICAPATSAGARVLRGGAWNSAPGAVRSAYRNRNFPESRYSFVGFRIAEDTAATDEPNR